MINNMFLKVSVLCVLYACSVAADSEPYTVPQPRIEVFQPRGLRVSIPDYRGLRLFAFHGVVNRELAGLEAGDLSKDILKRSHGRWVFEDNKLKLNRGDTLNFWLFVIKGNLGYRLDDQTYTVTNFLEAPPGFISPGKGPNRKTTTETPAAAHPEYEPLPVQPSTCHCNPQQLPPITIIPPICILPVQQTTQFENPTTTPLPPPTISTTPDIVIWRELLVNLSNENAEYRDKLLILRENNRLLVSKLEKIGDENLNKLNLGGKIFQDDNPRALVTTVLREKLGITDTHILKSAVRNTDGTITFELQNIDDKLLVLRLANDKLKNSKITIKDIDTISFINPNSGNPTIDMRTQAK